MGERLGPDGRLDRAAVPAVVNGNDEYALEAALKLVEAHGGEVTLLSMAPASAPETMRKALAMGATRGVARHGPGARRLLRASPPPGPCRGPRDARVRPRAGRRRHLRRRRRAWSRPASRPSPACRTSPTPRRSSLTRRPGRSASDGSAPTGYDVLEAPMPALDHRHAGARRAALPVAQGDHGARARRRSPRCRWRTSASTGRRSVARSRRRRSSSRAQPPARGRHAGDPRGARPRPRARSSTSSPSGGSSDGAAAGRRRGRARRFASTKLSTEVATLARTLARPAATSVEGVVVRRGGRGRGQRARRVPAAGPSPTVAGHRDCRPSPQIAARRSPAFDGRRRRPRLPRQPRRPGPRRAPCPR